MGRTAVNGGSLQRFSTSHLVQHVAKHEDQLIRGGLGTREKEVGHDCGGFTSL